ncbi:Interleukin-1 receptor-associated kinase 4 [Halotydeus destructor]|nr:Interleukin-1 receptor-associated kinase 4 [Halotydeus destructor]
MDKMQPLVTEETELRHLSPGHRRTVASILDQSDGWRELASSLKRPDGQDGYLLTSSNIRILEQMKHVAGGSSPTQALIDYWATCSRKRPSLKVLVDTLVQCNLYRAADYVKIEILGQAEHTGQDGDLDLEWCEIKKCSEEKNANNVVPSAPSLPFSSACDANQSLGDETKQQNGRSATKAESRDVEHAAELLKQLGIDNNVQAYAYNDLVKATGQFEDRYVKDGGCKLGEGAFGSVFRAKVDGNEVAVKSLKSEFGKQFLNEVSTMVKFKHSNLLPILGISSDGPSLCLILEYMEKGSLFSALTDARQRKEELNEKERINIAVGTARALVHLHSFLEIPFVHRDVKSDNILLDSKMAAKLGDFGLARSGTPGTGHTTSRNLTQNIIGTTVYMAPEAFRGDLSVKLDTFSFGVVLLELITGLKPYDENRDEPDILSHVEELLEATEDGAEETSYADRNVNWNQKTVMALMGISKRATEQRKKLRPTMEQILDSLEKLS